MTYPILSESVREQLLAGLLGVFESTTAPVGAQDLLLVHLDADGMVTYVSPSIFHLTGYQPTEVIGRSWISLFGKAIAEKAQYWGREDRWDARNVVISEGTLQDRSGQQRILTWRVYWHPNPDSTSPDSTSGEASEVPVGGAARSGAMTVVGLDVTYQRNRLTHAKEITRRLEEREQILGTLDKLNRQLGRSLDLAQIYRLIHSEIAQRFLGAPHFVVALLDDDRITIRCTFAIVDNQEMDPNSFPAYPMGEGPTSDCIRSGQAKIVDLRALRAKLSHGRIVHMGDDNELPNSGIYVPLLAGDTVIGVISVQRYEVNAFDETDLYLLSVLAGMAGAAIQNARLFRKLETQAEQMSTVMGAVNHGLILLDEEGRVVLTNPVAKTYLAILDEIGADGRLSALGGIALGQILAKTSANPEQSVDVVSGPAHAQQVFEVSSAVIGSGQAPSGWVLVIRDVTEVRQTQRMTQQQERLAAVGQLAAGIAHDFNNIMGTIIILAQAMQIQLTDDSKRRRLDTIVAQANHAADLIRQILDFSRRSVVERMPLDVAPFLKELVQLLRRTLPENIEVELHMARPVFVIDGDLTRIQQVLMNLAVNARDAMPDGGTLTFMLDSLAVNGNAPMPQMAPGDWLHLQVADTGTGIPQEIQDHIFEPFFTTKEVGSGTGLGLAQVYGIVQQHGGQILLESIVNQGTTFHLYFPLVGLSTLAEAESVPSSDSTTRAGGTILVVEDEPTMREALEDILMMAGYKVVAAANGAEALSMLAEVDDVELIMSDLVMPVMGGEELGRRLQEIRPDIAILFMTGHPLRSEDKRKFEEGQVQWLQKPFSADDVLAEVAEMMGAAASE